MNHEGWSAAVQTAVIAISTWYIRQGGRRDRRAVVKTVASQAAVDQVLERVSHLEAELAIVKRAVVRDHEDRGLTALKRDLSEQKNRKRKDEER